MAQLTTYSERSGNSSALDSDKLRLADEASLEEDARMQTTVTLRRRQIFARPARGRGQKIREMYSRLAGPVPAVMHDTSSCLEGTTPAVERHEVSAPEAVQVAHGV